MNTHTTMHDDTILQAYNNTRQNKGQRTQIRLHNTKKNKAKQQTKFKKKTKQKKTKQSVHIETCDSAVTRSIGIETARPDDDLAPRMARIEARRSAKDRRQLLETTLGRNCVPSRGSDPSRWVENDHCQNIRQKSLQHLLFPGGHPSR